MPCARTILLCTLLVAPTRAEIMLAVDGYQVRPGVSLQAAIELAAVNPTNKTVVVHEGNYRPDSKRQALIWLNRKHDGVRLIGKGAVTLSAANPALSTNSEASYPAVVNHVIYVGDGISSNTLISGFRLTGANHFVTRAETRKFEPNGAILKNSFFYEDGGAIKIFGRSYPTIRGCEIVDNYTSPCGAGISIQHQGFNTNYVTIENCVFMRNRAEATGSAVDLLAGSAARIINCLFVANVSNLGEDPVAKASGERPFVNSGVLTVFPNSIAEVSNCTFTGNRNGVDDMGGRSRYVNSIFYGNNLDAGLKGYRRYDLAVNAGGSVSNCFFNGTVHDMQKIISTNHNILNAPAPQFDDKYVPRAVEYSSAGYRPKN